MFSVSCPNGSEIRKSGSKTGYRTAIALHYFKLLHAPNHDGDAFAIRREGRIDIVFWREVKFSVKPLTVHKNQVSGEVARWPGRIGQYSSAGRARLRHIVFFSYAGLDFGRTSQHGELVRVKC